MFALSPLPRKLEAALRDFASPKLELRRDALKDLVRHARSGEAAAARALMDALRDPLEEIRADAALGLANAERRESAEALARLALEDSSARARQMALLALGELGDGRSALVLAALERARTSELAAERFQALLAGHQLGTPDAARAIVDGMLDSDGEVRRLALRVARAHFAAARSLPDTARKRARAALEDSAPEVRAAAALTLAEFGDMTGKSILLALVGGRGGPASAEDEQAAMELSAELGLEEARPLLARRAFARFFRDPLAYDARIALARLGDERARAILLAGLDAWTRDARTLAVAAIGRARLHEARARIQALEDRPERVDPAAVREALALLDEGSSVP
jgi:HEAT repeat protein